jgi:predicted transcriptional regulator of viral defense system
MTPKLDLEILVRACPSGFVSIPTAREALGLTTNGVAGRRLAALTRLGWLTRARRGLYSIAPLGTAGENATAEDAWVLAARCWAPCYIGGWTAAEYWGLTEQLFRSTFVASAASFRATHQVLMGTEFNLARVPMERVDGLALVWRGTERVSVSGLERTLVDAARDPAWAGGARHLSEMVGAFASRSDANADALASTLHQFGNGAAAKRLGFLVEREWPAAARVIEAAASMKSAGIIKLDPRVKSRGRIVKRWGISVADAERQS